MTTINYMTFDYLKEDLNWYVRYQEYEHTPTDRLELIQFYESKLGQAIYSWRSKSIEPLIEHIKNLSQNYLSTDDHKTGELYQSKVILLPSSYRVNSFLNLLCHEFVLSTTHLFAECFFRFKDGCVSVLTSSSF